MGGEVWRPIAGFEGLYEVSDRGRVRSLDRVVDCGGSHNRPHKKRLRGRVRRLWKMPNGYLHVSLCCNGVTKSFYVHRLVLDAFAGPCPKGQDGSHLDGTRSNNSVDNLAWETRKKNLSRMVEHGTIRSGEKNPGSKLTNDKVRSIREMAGAKTGRELARIFSVSPMTISRIINHQLWTHI